MTDVDTGAVVDRDRAVERFYAAVQEVLGVELDPGSHFLDLGGDSMDAVIVADMMAEEFGAAPELDAFFISESVRDLADKWWEAASQQSAEAR
jgi:acyl carrier protein